jgi:glycosyltransferase involved in cell wall biosynthesis
LQIVSDKTMRICIVAEHASNRFGGEAVLPLHYFSRLRKRKIEAWLVVHSRTRAELETLFPEENERIQYIGDTWLHKLLFRISTYLPRRIGEMTAGLLSQLVTQREQRRVVRKLVAREELDVVHQPIPVSPRFPSLMANLGAPVVIGPMNGGMEYPAAFRGTESFISRMAVGMGRSMSGVVHSILSGKKYASVLLVANERTRLALPSCAQGKVIEIPENGVDMATWATDSIAVPSSTHRFLFIGRLVDWKGVDMIIEALSHVPDAELEIIGNGGMRQAWQELANELGLDQRVHFAGFLSQSECAPRLQSAVALLLPSIYECGGAVVLEAMAAGTAVIATKWGGPADYLDDSCGVLVEPFSRAAIVDGFAKGMRQLIDSPELQHRLGAAGKQRVQQYFDWEKKVDSMLEIYGMAMRG